MGGAIKKEKVKRKRDEPSEKIIEAMEQNVLKGGALKKKKIRRRDTTPSNKLLEAVAEDVQKGGSIKFHDRRHKYLYEKLSGKGAGFDSELCRKMMMPLLQKRHPAFLNSYLKGKAHNLPQHAADHLHNTPRSTRKESNNHITMFGGSMSRLTHSENGLLRAHEHQFNSHFEIV